MSEELLDGWKESAGRKRQALREDPSRPVYHFLPPQGWMNDPNGLTKWQGRYHLFYQHNPHRAAWGAPYWGHAASEDLVHWIDYPPALTPDMPPEDDGGCWSGCFVDNLGVPTFVYTGVKGGAQSTCLAYGDPTLTFWRKEIANPVVAMPAFLDITRRAYRDPYVWRENDIWYQVVGTSIGGRGQVLLYCSQDLKSWQYLHPLMPQDVREELDDIGHIWECPNFLSIDGQRVLIVSLWRDGELTYPIALLGDYRDQRFYPDRVQQLDSGYRCFYAPLTLRDEDGRTLMWGWLQEQRSHEAQLHAGWSGVMSLPRMISLNSGWLQFSPASELRLLRRAPYYRRDEEVMAAGGSVLDASVPLEAEIELSYKLEPGSSVTVVLQATGEAEPQDVLSLTYGGERLTFKDSSGVHEHPMYRPTQTDDAFSVNIFIDRSVIEIFVSLGTCHSTRMYELPAESLSIQAKPTGTTRLISYKRWTLALTSPVH